VYRPEKIPDVTRVLHEWKNYCVGRHGMVPIFCAVRTSTSVLDECAYRASGFDVVVDFQPNRRYFPATKNPTGMAIELMRKALSERLYNLLRDGRLLRNRSLTTVIDYGRYVDACLAGSRAESITILPSVFPSWDNSARRTSATIIENHNVSEYQRWLNAAIQQVSTYSDSSRIVFINAWNEWAEGCHLEPDIRHGLSFLAATKECLQESKR
jgi:hypothetical protein